MTEKIIIPFFGYEWMPHLPFAIRLETELGVEVDPKPRLANQCLEAAVRTQYPVIIINYQMGTGSSDFLPPTVLSHFYNYQDVACYLIGEVKRTELNRDTPIIVICPYPDLVEKYKLSGADYVLDNSLRESRESRKRLVDIVREKLN